MAPQADESFSVGFVYFTENLSHHGYMCPVCRGVFKELSDLQDDLRRHKVDASNVTLPVRPLWFRSIEDGSRDASWLNVEIPGGEFLKHIHNDREKKDVRTPAVTIKMEWDQLTDETMLLEATDVSAEQYKVETGSADGFSDRTPDEDDEDDAPDDYDIGYDDDDCKDPDFTEKKSPRTRKNSRRPGRQETASATVTSADVGGKDSEEKKNLADNKVEHVEQTCSEHDASELEADKFKLPPPDEDGWYTCPFCTKKMKISHNMKRHIRSHSDNEAISKPHVCDRCDYRASSQYEIRKHIKIKHEGHKLCCDQCTKQFTTRTGLRAHVMLIHEDAFKFKCSFCEQKFIDNLHYESHVNKHLGIKPHACDTCSMTFGHKSNLNRHKKECTLDVKIHCAQCGRLFKSDRTMKHHMKVAHSGIKQYHCVCGQVYKWRESLHRHKKKCEQALSIIKRKGEEIVDQESSIQELCTQITKDLINKTI